MLRKLKGFISLQNFAQLALAILVFPILAIVISKIAPEQAQTFFANHLTGVELFGSLADIFSGLSGEVNTNDVLTHILNVVNNTMFEASILGMCVDICTHGLKFKGLAFLQSVLGVFIGCIILQFTPADPLNNLPAFMAVYFVLYIIDVIIIWVLNRQGPLAKLMNSLISPAFSVITAGAMAAFVAVLSVVMRGYVSFLDAILAIEMSLLLLLILLVINLLFFKDE